MDKFKRVLWIVLGLTIFLSLFFTRVQGVDGVTKKLIDQAMDLELETSWPHYTPNIYPVDIYKKNILKDTTLRYSENQWVEMKDKEPIYALTMVRDPDGQAVLSVIDARSFRGLSDIGQFNRASSHIYYQAMIIHEAFHCFQADQGFYDAFAEEITKYEQGQALTIARQLDDDPKYQKLWDQEIQALITHGLEDEATYLTNYQECYQARKDYLIDKFGEEAAEEYLNYSSLYEKAEGTAQYMENIALCQLSGETLKLNYQGYTKGTAKYYQSGFFKAYILDKHQGNQWKEDFFRTSDQFEDHLFAANSEK